MAGGNVTVRYLDTKGNPISEDVILKGEVGEEYKTEQKAIAGYTFKEVQGNPIGQFTKDPQTVTYIYARNATGPSNSEQKRDDKPNYKNEKHYNRMSNSNKKLLPKTGENQKISFICIGVVLLCVVTTIIQYV
ncbi:hypothetical protein D2A91_13815 [Enterococcus faecalis]|nr:hypothetical protein [Enterococcus faecalis]